LNPAEIEMIAAWPGEGARFAIASNSFARRAFLTQTGEDGICLPDPVAIAVALDPTIGTDWSEHYVDVEIQSELTRGMTVVDRLNVAGDSRNCSVWSSLVDRPPNVKVSWGIDIKRWKELLYSALQ
jgi:purine nucleosidase